jgi:hypothetical protein
MPPKRSVTIALLPPKLASYPQQMHSSIHRKSSRDSRLALFLKRNDQKLRVIGALLVFVTFVAKEGLRDHYKDQNDALDSARRAFIARSDSDNISVQMRNLKRMLIRNEGLPTNSFGYVTDQESLLFEMAGGIRKKLDNAQDILKGIPQSKVIRTNIDALQEVLSEIHRKRGDFDEQIGLWEEESKRMSRLQTVPPGDSLALHELTILTQRANFQTDRLNSSVLKSATYSLEKNEERLRIFNWVSWIAYALGWGLSLVGGLFRIDGLMPKD